MKLKFPISVFTIVIIGYLLGIVCLFLYSFTQVDLSLTLSRASWVQDVEKSFQYIGYFNRPLSTYLFIGIMLILYALYCFILLKISYFSKKQVWGIIIFSALLLSLAYNAFSYDLFNYIFDAKIFTHYHKNPYEYKALDFPGDPMLSFMRWTHREYPYGPVWLGLTIPLSYIGLNYFVITFFLFKGLMLSSFVGTTWLISKILKYTYPKYELFGIAFFALNPFVLIESLVSAHNDIVMLFFLVIAVYFLIKKYYFITCISLILGYGLKFATASISLPVHVAILCAFVLGVYIYSKIQKKVSWDFLFIMAGGFMILAAILASARTTFQPWYLLGIFPFAALLSKKNYIILPVIVFSLFSLSEYIPFLFLGNWDAPVPAILHMLTIWGIVVSLGVSMILFLFSKYRKV